MQPSDRKAFLEIVIGFAELKGKQLSAPALELYWNAMQAWSLDDFRAAANHLIRTCEFMPTPKDFEELKKAARPTTGEAWLAARKALQWGLHGYTVKDGTDPLIAKAIAVVGGANLIAMTEESKLPFVERAFNEAYDSLQDSNDTRVSVPQIAAPKALKLPNLGGRGEQDHGNRCG